MFMNTQLNIQYISDTEGNTTGVIVPSNFGVKSNRNRKPLIC